MTSPSATRLVPVLVQHRFDEAALARYLKGKVPGFERDGTLKVSQFQGGQSNPTYHLATPAGNYVLRKKPPGKLLPSAHAVDREFRALRALAGTDVPVPKAYALCEDDAVIGQMFYIMDNVEGRHYFDLMLPDQSPAERRALHLDAVRVLARLNRLDYSAIGLADYGRPEGYATRQVARWSKQYESSEFEVNPDMNNVIAWLRAHPAPHEESSLVHGDLRLHNMLLHPTEPCVIAVIDWELATLGHPIGDLGYFCSPYHLDVATRGGFKGADLRALGIPEEDEIKETYCATAGREDLPDWPFFIVFSLFRSAAIRAGIYARVLNGNAVNPEARTAGESYRGVARAAWNLAQQSA